MTSKTQTIEIDEATATALRGQAAAQGLSVAELVAGLTALAAASVTLSRVEMENIDLQWSGIQAGEATVSHDDVARWLGTWGTADFKPWHSR